MIADSEIIVGDHATVFRRGGLIKKALPWSLRILLVTALALLANYVLYSDDAAANHPNRYALVREYLSPSYHGIQADLWFGDPSSCCPDGGFSNGTLWAAQDYQCTATFPYASWVETGWYEGWKGGVFGRYYKFIYKVPQSNCMYTEANIGGYPDYGDIENFRLERYSVGEWRWYWQGFHTATVQTGWSSGNASRVEAGGEVGGHQTGIGMQGAALNLKYKRSLTWFTWTASSTDEYFCSLPGYELYWIGTDDIFFASGGTGCPE